MSDKFQFNYGLIVVDGRQEDDEMIDILHFCAYEKPPTINEVKDLKRELSEDEEFGLTEISEHLMILPAPKYLVEKYKKEFDLDNPDGYEKDLI